MSVIRLITDHDATASTEDCRTGSRTAGILSGFVMLILLATPLVAQTKHAEVEEVTFWSTALNQQVAFSVVLPASPAPTGGYPVLMILHGLGRNHKTLLENSETLALLKAQPYLIVLPDSGRGWWINSPESGAHYDGMLLEIVTEVEKRYPVSRSPARWGVMGWSMGGFGALHFAERHPDQVSFVGSIIGLLDFPRVEGLPVNQRFPVDESVFGKDPSEWIKENPSHHLAPLAGKELVIVVGEQAFDRTMNENFLRKAHASGLQPVVYRIKGKHVFTTVMHGLEILLPLAAAHFRQIHN